MSRYLVFPAPIEAVDAAGKVGKFKFTDWLCNYILTDQAWFTLKGGEGALLAGDIRAKILALPADAAYVELDEASYGVLRKVVDHPDKPHAMALAVLIPDFFRAVYDARSTPPTV